MCQTHHKKWGSTDDVEEHGDTELLLQLPFRWFGLGADLPDAHVAGDDRQEADDIQDNHTDDVAEAGAVRVSQVVEETYAVRAVEGVGFTVLYQVSSQEEDPCCL